MEKLKKKPNVLMSLLLCAIGCFAGNGNLVLQDLDYTDLMQTLANYDRGFYQPQGLHIKVEGTTPIEKPYGKLVHLRADIAEFSSRARLKIEENGGKRDTTFGKSQDLTASALEAIQTSFDNIRKNGSKVIVRFCYDPWFNGNSNVTPEHEWVLRHVEQLAPILSKNVDVIVALEMGMHGAYGEMHSDTAITYPRVAEAVNKMLRLTPPELKILTRTGNYSAAVLGFEKWGVDFNIESDVFKQIAKAKGDTMYRVGMFNDGYLGTQYDYGTWGADCATSICREEGVAWLEKYSVNTPYGGEALETAGGYQVINTPEFLAYEGFRTHTSYLNLYWNDKLIARWKATHFGGKDFEYDGTAMDSLTGFKYIDDHLGYRFVLRESRLTDTVDASGDFMAELKIQNVGFGNLTRPASAELVLVEDVGVLDVCPVEARVDLPDIDFRKVHSREIKVVGADTTLAFDGTNDVKFEASLSKLWSEKSSILRAGLYHVYLKVGDIQFANKEMGQPCIEENPGLYLGKVFVDPSKVVQNTEMLKTFAKENRRAKSTVEVVDHKVQIRVQPDIYKNQNNRVFRPNGVAVPQ